ncbi:DNA (cytosine-5-)-methyltransferase [Clostridium sporogenes]|nr:DNA cytosine methyltransferase [Clostridium botulinum]KRU26552.1 DNA (cytosine-5-)-methyltransferase [Clostridium sporogenes]KRU28147.1 DNA (cytosine-5-)-methyltransferase [Clostridium sporogenes]KRU29063.1 DNA (cytosine-5-)-methyltransferase [Clostridium sporogenes]KRU39852.1 DNA (cytosine-5-)-methyltransferase [Clostridium sporogenes]MBZ1329554.1 DNA cytosine methyltransferase [Clostridium botulinum]
MIAIDLFCGAGGMSEGILQAGFHIAFSSDINRDAALTYINRHKQLGLIEGYNTHFELTDIRNLTGKFIKESIENLEIYRNAKDMKIDAIFGGPPCQGFSRSGRRQKDDPRNFLFREYIRVINEVKPRYVVMENVEGIMDMTLVDFKGLDGVVYGENVAVPEILISEFNKIGYNTLEPRLLDASDYGVPQRRKRAIFIAYQKGEKVPCYPKPTFSPLEKVTVLDAIGDLISDIQIRTKINPDKTSYQVESIKGRTLKIDGTPVEHNGEIYNYEFSSHSKCIVERFSIYNEGEDTQTLRRRIKRDGIYIKNKHHLLDEAINSLKKIAIKKLRDLDEKYNVYQVREALINNNASMELINSCNTEDENNGDESIQRVFGNLYEDEIKYIINLYSYNRRKLINVLKKGNAPDEVINSILTKKNNRKRINRNEQSPTIVTLPDDYISPFENRIFSVREMARLQSFDDSFKFLGKRTTGGPRRKMEVPQYTQVGNAVPPLLAKSIALEIKKALE